MQSLSIEPFISLIVKLPNRSGVNDRPQDPAIQTVTASDMVRAAGSARKRYDIRKAAVLRRSAI